MSQLAQIARPYAKAAFRFAVTKQTTQEWHIGLQLLAELFTIPAIMDITQSPQWSAQHSTEVIVSVISAYVDPSLVLLVRLLGEKRRLSLLSTIYRLYDEYYRHQNRVLPITVTTAAPWTANEQTQLVEALATQLQQKMVVEWQVDAALLGGAIIQAEDLVVDGSYRNKLSRLQEELTKS